jgi:hypothetical protein
MPAQTAESVSPGGQYAVSKVFPEAFYAIWLPTLHADRVILLLFESQN